MGPSCKRYSCFISAVSYLCISVKTKFADSSQEVEGGEVAWTRREEGFNKKVEMVEMAEVEEEMEEEEEDIK